MPRALSWNDLAMLGAVATAARTFNLGTFSLWLDEVLIMTRARGGPAKVWAACTANAEHPPLSALSMAGLNAVGASDTVHRLLSIALGIATVLLLASWGGRRFGRGVGVVTGLVSALLPFHVRYSQELRPYPYVLFFAALALVAAERLETRPGPAATAQAFVALLGGFYSHHLFVLVLVPVAWPLVEAVLARDPARRRMGRQGLRALLVATGTALLLLLPWLLAIRDELAVRPPGGGVVTWTWRRTLSRWQFLTVAGREGDLLTWAGALALGLALIGAVAAVRRSVGRAAVAGAVVGIGAAELLLSAIGHWTSGRYDVIGWLFLPVLIALGVAAIAARRATRLLAALLLAVLVVGELAGLARYARLGRPAWHRVAAAVAHFHRPGEPVLVENEKTRISLGYYLLGRDFLDRSGEDGAPTVVGANLRGLRRLWPADRAGVVVLAAQPQQRELRRWARAFPVVARFPQLDTRVVFLVPEVRQRLFAAGVVAAGPAAATAAPSALRNVPLPAAELGPPSWLERLGTAIAVPRARSRR